MYAVSIVVLGWCVGRNFFVFCCVTLHKVWTLVDLPDDRQAIENKWIFKKKTDADGSVTIYKARLVAKKFFDKFKVLTTMRFSQV